MRSRRVPERRNELMLPMALGHSGCFGHVSMRGIQSPECYAPLARGSGEDKNLRRDEEPTPPLPALRIGDAKGRHGQGPHRYMRQVISVKGTLSAALASPQTERHVSIPRGSCSWS